MSTKLKLTIGAVLLNTFAPAFDALCSDTSISMRDRYALGRSMRDIKGAVDDYEKQRVNLVKEFGEPEVTLLARQLNSCADLQYLATLKNKTQGMQHFKDEQFVENLKSKLEYLTKNKVESWGIDAMNDDKMKSFRDKLGELQNVEFELYLDHKVKIGDASQLTAKDIATLIDLVEIAE